MKQFTGTRWQEKLRMLSEIGGFHKLFRKRFHRARSPLNVSRTITQSIHLGARDPKQTLRMRRYFMAAGTSLLAIGLLFACYLQDVLSSAAFYQSSALVLLVALIFYIAFRTRLNLRFSDPSLTVLQMSAATIVTLYAMYAANGARAVFLVLLLMIFLFGVLRLTIRTLLVYAAGILGAYGGVIGLLWYCKPQSLNLRLELLQWLALAFTLPWFAVMGGFVSGLRNQLLQSNNNLQGMLQRVQMSEASLAEAQRIAGLGGWTLDPARHFATWTLETYRLFGINPALPAPKGLQFLRLVHPEDRRHYNSLIQAAFREARDFDGQFRIVLPTGEIRWVQALGHPNADGKTTLLRGTVLDITAHKTAEEALIQSQALLRDLAAHEERIKEEERKRIAREIHDELGGLLTGITAYMTVSIDNAERAGTSPDHGLVEAWNLANIAIDTVRRVISDLRPSVLDQLGVWSALEWYAGQIQERTGLRCECTIDAATAATPIDPERSIALFRIVQEALTNVVRHAEASRVSIRATRHDGSVMVEVEDNGRGIEIDRLLNRESWGIVGMHERARYFGGELKVTGLSGQGTTVVLRVPMENTDE